MKLRPIKFKKKKEKPVKQNPLDRLLSTPDLTLADAADFIRGAFSDYPELVSAETMVRFQKAHPHHYTVLSKHFPPKLSKAIDALTLTRTQKEEKADKKNEAYGLKKGKKIFAPRRGD